MSSQGFDDLDDVVRATHSVVIEHYRPYQTTFQKTKIFGEVKEVLEENSP